MSDDLLKLLGEQPLAPGVRVLLGLALLSLLPAIVTTATSFLRTIVVLSFVRQGVGTPQTPPNQVIVGLALFLTLFTMSPVLDEMRVQAYEPFQRGEITDVQAFERASVPLKRFMLRETREADLELFYDATHRALPATPDEVPLSIALPAFAVSELTTAFQMGATLLLPFLVVDLVVATLLMSMGMMMVPPTTMSLPLKLLLFVLCDGWNLVAGTILRSFS
ncbi:MAG: flagellar type III secretion system pore protein FliP [Polyangiaceae bacterium]|nr:flagellar type III secretion system pore protein FliP [Polyangiaceae bacterium]